ncbi:myosin, light chain 12 [Trichuris trichiura]|uniref:Myosin, light chain 12 n=1 Tax=Trichuris trichiura TaxID=36087 RepID=A0A077ZEB2_TRITR|nr:myosin, light chain 12 [Trichuris trichiura]
MDSSLGKRVKKDSKSSSKNKNIKKAKRPKREKDRNELNPPGLYIEISPHWSQSQVKCLPTLTEALEQGLPETIWGRLHALRPKEPDLLQLFHEIEIDENDPAPKKPIPFNRRLMDMSFPIKEANCADEHLEWTSVGKRVQPSVVTDNGLNVMLDMSIKAAYSFRQVSANPPKFSNSVSCNLNSNDWAFDGNAPLWETLMRESVKRTDVTLLIKCHNVVQRQVLFNLVAANTYNRDLLLLEGLKKSARIMRLEWDKCLSLGSVRRVNKSLLNHLEVHQLSTYLAILKMMRFKDVQFVDKQLFGWKASKKDKKAKVKCPVVQFLRSRIAVQPYICGPIRPISSLPSDLLFLLLWPNVHYAGSNPDEAHENCKIFFKRLLPAVAKVKHVIPMPVDRNSPRNLYFVSFIKSFMEQLDRLFALNSTRRIVLVGWGVSCIPIIHAVTKYDSLCAAILMDYQNLTSAGISWRNHEKLEGFDKPLLYVVGEMSKYCNVNRLLDVRTKMRSRIESFGYERSQMRSLETNMGTVTVCNATENLSVLPNALFALNVSQACVNHCILEAIVEFLNLVMNRTTVNPDFLMRLPSLEMEQLRLTVMKERMEKLAQVQRYSMVPSTWRPPVVKAKTKGSLEAAEPEDPQQSGVNTEETSPLLTTRTRAVKQPLVFDL